MDFDTQVKLAVYQHFAENGRGLAPDDVATRLGSTVEDVLSSYRALRELRVLVLSEDGVSIRMAPPFSGVVTQHMVESGGVTYYANCAWDALGILAALGRSGMVRSRCEQSREPLALSIGVEGPEESDWLFHCLVAAAQWWEDIVFT